jgi:hypothetical protein
MRINANGRGSLNGSDCTFSVANNVLTVRLGSDSTTLVYSVGSDGITFSGIVPGNNWVLNAVLTLFVTASPIEREIPVQADIPPALVGTWGDSIGFSLGLDGLTVIIDNPAFNYPEVFVINSDGTGKSVNTFTKDLDDCTWSVNGNKITLNSTGMTCTFDWVINDAKLSLSNPVPADSALAGYSTFTAMSLKADSRPPSISDYTWSNTIPADIVGTWSSLSLFAPTPDPKVFEINANGSGKAFVAGAPELINGSFAKANGHDKIRLTVPGFGSVMYDYAIVTGQLFISNPVLAEDASAGLAAYHFFIPLEK